MTAKGTAAICRAECLCTCTPSSRQCVAGVQPARSDSRLGCFVLFRRFDFRFAGSAKDVGMATGATIHTANGLKVRVSRRQPANQQTAACSEPVAAAV